MRYSKRSFETRQGAEKSFSILHPENHTSRCVDTGNTNVAVRVEPRSAAGLLNTHLFNSALAQFFFSLKFYKTLYYHRVVQRTYFLKNSINQYLRTITVQVSWPVFAIRKKEESPSFILNVCLHLRVW